MRNREYRPASPLLSHCCSSLMYVPVGDSEPEPQPRIRIRPTASLLKQALEGNGSAEHQFFRFWGNKQYGMVRCVVDDNLQEVAIEKLLKPESSPKSIRISDLEVALDLSPSTCESLQNFPRKLYGFRLISRRKIYELATESQSTRDSWTSALKLIIGATADLRGRDCLRRYVELMCKVKEFDQRSFHARAKVMKLEKRLFELDERVVAANREVVALVLNQVVTKVEIKEESSRIENLPDVVQQLESQYLRAVRRQEIAATADTRRSDMRKLLRRAQDTEVWRVVIATLEVDCVFRLRFVSRKLRRMCEHRMRTMTFWEKQSAVGLVPRRYAWLEFCRRFYAPTMQTAAPVSAEVLQDIRRDLHRSHSANAQSIERILVSLCGRYEDVGYCQGMHLMTEFLVSTLQDEHSALQVLSTVMSPPYSLCDVWRPGLPRLKLVAYQLEELLKLKLPTLASHFDGLDLPLEIFVAPWILTLFTQLVSATQTRMPAKVLVRIWDLFLVRGWKAVLAVSLAILHLSEGQSHIDQVLGESLDVTMACYHKDLDIDFSHIFVLYSLFEPDSSLLQDFERRFTHKANL